MTGRSVVINGDLGSGKSTVSTVLAHRLGVRRISVGDVYRELARRRGMTALELNLRAELDDKIDHYVDQMQRDIATSGEIVVVDSRLAWHFFRDAVKVHLITDPLVAAHRVLHRPASSTESYTGAIDAQRRLAERSESERVRFLQRYGVDKTWLRNYDVVCDSTRATPDEIVATILHVLAQPPGDVRLFVDPHRLRAPAPGGPDEGPVLLRYVRPHFDVVGGGATVVDAQRGGHTLVPATLVSQADEPAR